MKRPIFVILILLSTEISYTQSTLNIRFYDNCRDTYITRTYELMHENKTVFLKDSVIQIDAGQYLIAAVIDRNGSNVPFLFPKNYEDQKIYFDTIEFPRIVHINYWEFYNCNMLCNGHEIGYYKDGKKYIEGNFTNGRPKGRVKYYDPNGNLLKTEFYTKKGLKKTKQVKRDI
jgi:hypothetical protein